MIFTLQYGKVVSCVDNIVQQIVSCSCNVDWWKELSSFVAICCVLTAFFLISVNSINKEMEIVLGFWNVHFSARFFERGKQTTAKELITLTTWSVAQSVNIGTTFQKLKNKIQFLKLILYEQTSVKSSSILLILKEVVRACNISSQRWRFLKKFSFSSLKSKKDEY